MRDGKVIATASAVWQARFRESPQFQVIDGDRTGRCLVEMYGTYHKVSAVGSNFKDGKARAAEKFLKELHTL